MDNERKDILPKSNIPQHNVVRKAESLEEQEKEEREITWRAKIQKENERYNITLDVNTALKST